MAVAIVVVVEVVVAIVVAVVLAVVLAVGNSSSGEAGVGAEARRVLVAEHRESGVVDGSD